MEINVTRIMEDHDLESYSDSVFNSGLSNIGQVTWRNACQAIEDLDEPLVTEAQQDDLRDWIGDFGAWSSEEIAAMSDVETQALLLQFVAGDGQAYLRAEEDDRVEEYQESEGGRLYKCDVEGLPEFGEWFFYVGI